MSLSFSLQYTIDSWAALQIFFDIVQRPYHSLRLSWITQLIISAQSSSSRFWLGFCFDGCIFGSQVVLPSVKMVPSLYLYILLVIFQKVIQKTFRLIVRRLFIS